MRAAPRPGTWCLCRARRRAVTARPASLLRAPVQCRLHAAARQASSPAHEGLQSPALPEHTRATCRQQAEACRRRCALGQLQSLPAGCARRAAACRAGPALRTAPARPRRAPPRSRLAWASKGMTEGRQGLLPVYLPHSKRSTRMAVLHFEFLSTVVRSTDFTGKLRTLSAGGRLPPSLQACSCSHSV